MLKAFQKLKQQDAKSMLRGAGRAIGKAYVPCAVVGLLSLYAAGAYAQVSFDENQGMFKDIICTMVKWIINLTIPAAMVCMIAAGIEYFRGEEIKGIVKKMLEGAVALTAVLSMIGVITWIARKFVPSIQTCNI